MVKQKRAQISKVSEIVAENPHVRIERIISTGHSSPGDSWYDQDEHEWVVVLKGEGKLMFEDDAEPIHMKPGDHINIPAQRRHRIEWTTPNEPTVWLRSTTNEICPLGCLGLAGFSIFGG